MNIDLNGHSTGPIAYETNDAGEVAVYNNGENPSTIASINVTTPNATFNLGNNITVQEETLVNNVALGTFNTQATHVQTVVIKDSDGGSVNFTNATINGGIKINPEQAATYSLIIRGEKPLSNAGGNASITILGESPDVILEGEVQTVVIEAKNSKFHLEDGGSAESITISKDA